MLSVVGFVVICEAFVGMELYENLFRQIFSGRALLVGKLPRTVLMGGFALAAAQIGQFMKLDEMSVTSISHDGLSSAGSAPHLGAVVRVAADHDGIVPGCPDEGATVTDVVLDVADDGTIRDPAKR